MQVEPLKLIREPGAIAVLGVLIGIWALSAAPGGPRVIGAYATDLRGRTPHQRHNAARAAAALDGLTIPSGAIFSFNKAVGNWTAERGYLRAPVSFDGLLVDAYGGGVCETSTTLYNAALLAGFPILERHPHTFSPSYAPPGRDAAVAYSNVDLQFRNTSPAPVTLAARVDGQMLVCRILSESESSPRVHVSSQVLEHFEATLPNLSAGVQHTPKRWRIESKEGIRVVVRRDWDGERGAPREIISDDTYLPVNSTTSQR